LGTPDWGDINLECTSDVSEGGGVHDREKPGIEREREKERMRENKTIWEPM
jgi:hypothetical protein